MGVEQLTELLSSPVGKPLVFLMVFLNSIGIPVTSEVPLILSGTGIHEGRLDLLSTFTTAVAVQLTGCVLAYWIGREGGSRLVLQYGHHLGVRPYHLKRARRTLRHRGAWMVLAAMLVPGLRGCISYPAGIAHVAFWHYFAAAALGVTIWTSILLSLGYFMSGEVEVVLAVFNQFSIGILAVFIFFILWRVKFHRSARARS